MSTETSACLPLTLNRKIADFPLANCPLSQHQRRVLGARPELAAHPHAWLTPDDLTEFLEGGKTTCADPLGNPLVWRGGAADSGSVHTARNSFLIRYPWDLLRANEQYVATLAATVIEGVIHPSTVVEGVLHLGPDSRILPGVFIEGNVVIGARCKIGPNCYIRGNTSIGDACHIGQSVEIKNCLILAHTQIGHLSYVGDSVIGAQVNFGAGTTTANLRHDGKNHRSMVNGALLDTGRRKFGAIVGDHVHTGIHTSIYPGRKLWPGTTTLPGEVVRRDIES